MLFFKLCNGEEEVMGGRGDALIDVRNRCNRLSGTAQL